MKTKFTLFFIVLFISVSKVFSQGQYPITADIGYAATTNEVTKHIAVPGYESNSEGDPYSYRTASGSYSIYYGAGNNTIKKPIIIVEGFDATDDYNPDDIIKLLNGSPSTTNDNLADQLMARGYDLIVLNFKDGGGLIQRNAFLLVKLIQHINNIKTTSCPTIVAGYSMGGLVARYALNYMENRSQTDASFKHNVGLFFSFDSPQKGANIPIGMQDLVRALGGGSGILFSSSADLRRLCRSMYSYAAQQMLIYHEITQRKFGYYATINPHHTLFMQQMKNLVGGDGYPRSCKKIAASLGSGSGIGQQYRVNYNDNYWINHTSSGPSINLAFDLIMTNNTPFIGYAIASRGGPLAYKRPVISIPYGVMEIYAASALTTINQSMGYYNSDIPADIMPGSYSPVFKSVLQAVASSGANYKMWMENACFIPSVSAIDCNTDNWFHDITGDASISSKTPFSSFYIGYSNRNHLDPVSGNYGLIQWLLGEFLIYENTLPCNKPSDCNYNDGQFMGTYLGKNVYARKINGCLYVTHDNPSNGPVNIDWLRGLNWSTGSWAVSPMTDSEIVSCFKNIGETCGGTSCDFNVSINGMGTVACGSNVTLVANCNGSDCGQISYEWSGPGVNSTNSQISFNVPNSPGNYTYTVKASKVGCSSKSFNTQITTSCGNPGGGGNSISCGGRTFTDGQLLGVAQNTRNVYVKVIGSCLYVTIDNPNNGPVGIDWIRTLNWAGGSWIATPMTDAEILNCFKGDNQPCTGGPGGENNGNTYSCGGYTFTNGQLLGTAQGRNVYVKLVGGCMYITIDNPNNGVVAKDWLYIVVDNNTWASNVTHFPRSLVGSCFKGENESCGGRVPAVASIEMIKPTLGKMVAVPNPATDLIEIKLTGDQDMQRATIHDMQGRKLIQTDDPLINIRNLPAGSYLIRVVTQKGHNFNTIFIKQ